MPDRASAIDPSLWDHDGLELATLLTGLLSDAVTALTRTVDGTPLASRLSVEIPPDDAGDFVSIGVLSWHPHVRAGFPNTFGGSTNKFPNDPVFMSPLCALSVRRPCQPIPSTAGFPHPDHLSAAAESLVYDARALTQVWMPAAEARVAEFCEGGRSMAWRDMRHNVVGDVASIDWEFRIEAP